MKMELDLRDLNRGALERLVRQLLVADESEEKAIMGRLEAEASDARKESDDLADLTEEKRGKPSAVEMKAEPKRNKPRG